MGGCSGKPRGGRASKYHMDEQEGPLPAAPPSGKSRKPRKAENPGPDTPNKDPRIQNTPKTARQRLDPADYRFVGQKAGVHFKAPGSINGQAFVIDDCSDCSIYILDRCAQVQIDNCHNCTIFIGPTNGSIFLRDSSQVKCAFITRQLRLRDVHDAEIALMCRTQPILESSSKVGLMCYDFGYAALAEQMAGAQLELWHNFWSHVYDFTPADDRPHWSFSTTAPSTLELLGGPELPAAVQQALGEFPFLPDQEPWVVTWGERPAPAGAYLFVLFPPGTAAAAEQFLQLIQQQVDGLLVLSTNKAPLTKQVVAEAGWKGGKTFTAPGASIGLELWVPPAASDQVKAAVSEFGGYLTTTRAAGQLFKYIGLD